MTKSKDERLEALYRRIPVVRCQGKCQAYCGPVPMQRHERLRIIKAVGVAPKADVLALACNMLMPDGTCRAYAVRPLICRAFGACEGLECPHGCEVAGRLLTRAEFGRLVAEAEAISPRVNPAHFNPEGLVQIGGI